VSAPRHSLGAAVLVSGLALLAPRSACAESKLELTAAPKKAEVALGDDIEMDVTLKNTGADQELSELEFDARSISFELSVDGGKTAWDAQFHTLHQVTMEIPLAPMPRKSLKAGESWTKTFTIPTVAAGTWSVTTVYAGTTPPVAQLAGIELKLSKQKSAPSTVQVKPAADGATQVIARLNTTVGTVQLRFFPKDALGSAINFVRIARTGFYDGKTFHRIDKSLGVVQGGAPKPDGLGDFPYTIPRELGLSHEPLRVGMARSQDPNSGSSQFYICVNDSPKVLNRPDGYAIFAEVLKGKDVVQTLFAVDVVGGQGPDAQRPKSPLKIESVKLQLAPSS
jgi:cyclophilin family peptidyl-prolyl cis-trans isomerase